MSTTALEYDREIFGSSGRERRDWLRVVMARAEEEAVSRIK